MAAHIRNGNAALARCKDGASEIDRSGGLIDFDNTDSASEPQDLPLIGRNGRRYSEAVLRHWSPAAIRALGIRRADGGPL